MHPIYWAVSSPLIQLFVTTQFCLQLNVRKSELEKRKNDDEQEEGWVACDLCGAWVHMICGMFNKGRNDEDMPYHCPDCLSRGKPANATSYLTLFSDPERQNSYKYCIPLQLASPTTSQAAQRCPQVCGCLL